MDTREPICAPVWATIFDSTRPGPARVLENKRRLNGASNRSRPALGGPLSVRLTSWRRESRALERLLFQRSRFPTRGAELPLTKDRAQRIARRSRPNMRANELGANLMKATRSRGQNIARADEIQICPAV